MTRWCDLRQGDVLVRKHPMLFCAIYILADAVPEKPGGGGTLAVKLLDNEVDVRPIRSDEHVIGSTWEVYFAECCSITQP